MTGLLSVPARADTGDLGFYLGGRLLPAISSVEGETLTGGGGAAFVSVGDDTDTTFGASALAGYHWSGQGIPLRTEMEFSYRFRNDFNTREQNTPAVGYKDDLSTTSLMFSVFYDVATDTPWRPYVGGGIGWARNMSSTTRALNDNSGATETIDNDTDNFAYSLQAGVRVAISPEWVGEIGYRYSDYGEVDTGKFSGGDQVTADSHVSHDLILGFAYLF